MNPWQQWPLTTAATHAPWLIGMALDAPLIAVSKRWPNRLHAVTLDGVVAGASRGTFESACGVRRLRLYGIAVGDRTVAALWPPRVKGMPDGRTRCQECWELTGRKRPRTEWRIGEVS